MNINIMKHNNMLVCNLGYESTYVRTCVCMREVVGCGCGGMGWKSF